MSYEQSNKIDSEKETITTFEEMSILREQGLLPREGIYHEPTTMIEVKRKNLITEIIDYSQRYGFNETKEISQKRSSMVLLVGNLSPKSLEEQGGLTTFGKMLGEYQAAVAYPSMSSK